MDHDDGKITAATVTQATGEEEQYVDGDENAKLKVDNEDSEKEG